MSRGCNFLSNVFVVTVLFACAATMLENTFSDWKTIESWAERHPYIVALLNSTKNYTCTGVIIDHRSVLTSGVCVHPEPLYVVVGSAVVGQRTSDNNIFKIGYAKAHEDYSLEVGRNNNITRMQSNIALVFTIKPVLLYFTESALLGNYFESELKDKKLSTIGFGGLSNAAVTVLQHQRYRQVVCTNPKWYYCICGIESPGGTYDERFGKGGPVFYGDEVIGVSAFPSGLLNLKDNVRYNVFTVISPYLQWIKKAQSPELHEFRRSASEQCSGHFYIVFLIVIKLTLCQYCMVYYYILKVVRM